MLPTSARFSVKMLVLRWTLKCREVPWQPAPSFDAFIPCLFTLSAQPVVGLHLSHFLSSLHLPLEGHPARDGLCLQPLFQVPRVWHAASSFFDVNCSHVIYMENS